MDTGRRSHRADVVFVQVSQNDRQQLVTIVVDKRHIRDDDINAQQTIVGKCHPGVAYFFPRPSSGSGCKRINLFLRWMVRKDGVDLGVWSAIPASKLIVPLDTHVIRLGRCLRLTSYTSPGWKMAAQITESLRALDPLDPVKYDFSLCHIGMSDQCGFNRPQRDSACPLKGFCKPRASARPSVRR